MGLKAVFMFVAPESQPEQHVAVVRTPAVDLTVVGVKDYAEAAVVAKKLAEEGNVAIELCAGFGVVGVAEVKKAVGDKAAVGVVRFDNHPGLEFKSGDALFA